MSAETASRFYFWGARALYVGPSLESSQHSHHAVQICIALEGKVRLRAGEHAPWHDYAGAIIPPDQIHGGDIVGGGGIASLWLEAEGLAYRRLVSEGSDAIHRIPDEILRRARPHFEVCLADDCDAQLAAQNIARALEHLALEDIPKSDLDPRVDQVLDRLERGGHRESLTELAAGVALSPSRFSHLFREQVGLPLRRYQLWVRLRYALGALGDGTSITQAAHDAGFSDAAHLSRTFRAMLGFAPSEALARISRFVQAPH